MKVLLAHVLWNLAEDLDSIRDWLLETAGRLVD